MSFLLFLVAVAASFVGGGFVLPRFNSFVKDQRSRATLVKELDAISALRQKGYVIYANSTSGWDKV